MTLTELSVTDDHNNVEHAIGFSLTLSDKLQQEVDYFLESIECEDKVEVLISYRGLKFPMTVKDLIKRLTDIEESDLY